MEVNDYAATLLLMQLKKEKKQYNNNIPVYLNEERNMNLGWERRGRVVLMYDCKEKNYKTMKSLPKNECRYQIAADKLKPIFGLQSAGYNYYETNTSTLLTLPLYLEDGVKLFEIKQNAEDGEYYVFGAAKTVQDYLSSFKQNSHIYSINPNDFLVQLIRIMAFRFIIGCSDDIKAENVLISNGNLISINEIGVKMTSKHDNKMSIGTLIMAQLASEVMKKQPLSDFIDVECVKDALRNYQHLFIDCYQKIEYIKNLFLH